MAHKVFISYRRDDARWQAREIYRAFERVLGREAVFMDVDSIPPGANFRKILKDWVDQCEVLLALIGPGWIDAADRTTGQHRLDDPNDFVRIEIAEALARGIPVVPLLLDGAPMPATGRLPADLQELSDRQAEPIEFRTFDADVTRLIRRLRLDSADGGGPASAPKDPSGAYRAEGRIKVDAKFVHGAPDGWFKPGAGKTEWFKDHEHGPEMVLVPAGEFMMGSPNDAPTHRGVIAQPFAVGRHAVTREEFAAFAEATGHKAEGAYVWRDKTWRKQDGWEFSPKASWLKPGFIQDGKHPVVCVSWNDAKAFASWLGSTYRLLSEAEWLYCFRAGTTSLFLRNDPVFEVYERGTAPVGSRESPHPWGLYHVRGVNQEWCEDVWHEAYGGEPPDGSPWIEDGNGDRRLLRNCADPSFFISYSKSLSPELQSKNPENTYYRSMAAPDHRSQGIGFRLMRTLIS